MTITTNSACERRRHQRTVLQINMQCIRLDPEGGDVVDTLQTTDISRTGIGAISTRAYYPGQRILLCMPLSSVGGRRNIYATVTRCRPCEEGYNVGMDFDGVSLGAWDKHSVAAA